MRIRRPLTAGLAVAFLLAMLPAAAATAADGAQVSIGDAVVSEPSSRSGTVSVELPVSVHGGAAGAVSVGWRTVSGSAGTSDFVAASGTLSLPAGAAGGAVAVQVRADKTTEGVESFAVELTSASGAAIGDGSGEVTIRPPAGGLSLGDVTVTEPDGGTLQIAVPATLGGPPNKAVTFGWQLRSSSGTIGEDAPAASGTTTIPKGTMGTLVRISINGDTTVEPDEDLDLVVTSVSNTALADGLGRVALVNTDVAPPPPPTDPFGWLPPADVLAGDTSILYVESPTGDYIGQGRTYRYTKADSVMTLSNQANRFQLSIDGDERWTLSIAEPSTYPAMTAGYWENVGRYPFSVPGLSFSGEGRGCNTLLGRFIVDSVTYAADLIDTITVRFEQRCEQTGPPLRGYFRWARTDPTQPPPPGDPADFPWSPPAGAVPETGNYLYFESTAGDYIGQGRTELYTDANRTFTPDWGTTLVQLFVDDLATAEQGWILNLDGRYNQSRLTVGLYDDVQRYPFHNRAKGGLSFYGEHRGCNELLGAFAIDEITWDGVELASFAARFVQRCEGWMPPLYGAVRWERP